MLLTLSIAALFSSAIYRNSTPEIRFRLTHTHRFADVIELNNNFLSRRFVRYKFPFYNLLFAPHTLRQGILLLINVLRGAKSKCCVACALSYECVRVCFFSRFPQFWLGFIDVDVASDRIQSTLLLIHLITYGPSARCEPTVRQRKRPRESGRNKKREGPRDGKRIQWRMAQRKIENENKQTRKNGPQYFSLSPSPFMCACKLATKRKRKH